MLLQLPDDAAAVSRIHSYLDSRGIQYADEDL